jgi:hypothetical protein
VMYNLLQKFKASRHHILLVPEAANQPVWQVTLYDQRCFEREDKSNWPVLASFSKTPKSVTMASINSAGVTLQPN